MVEGFVLYGEEEVDAFSFEGLYCGGPSDEIGQFLEGLYFLYLLDLVLE